MKTKSWFILLILFLLVFGLWITTKDYKSKSKEGNSAPAFTLMNQKSEPISLENFRGKVVLLNFWATWCPPCASEMGSLNQLSEHFKDKPFEVVAISLDEGGWKDIEAFQKKTPLRFTLLLDSKAEVADRFGTYRLPETYLIDPQGKILEKIEGPQNWTDAIFISKIEKAIQQSTGK